MSIAEAMRVDGGWIGGRTDTTHDFRTNAAGIQHREGSERHEKEAVCLAWIHQVGVSYSYDFAL